MGFQVWRAAWMVVVVAGVVAIAGCGKGLMNSANTKANEAKAQNNIGGIAKFCIVYAADNGDKGPPSLSYIVKEGGFVRDMLIDPRTGHEPMEISDQGQNGKELEAAVEAHCDYYYLGNEFKSEQDPEMIMLYDKSNLSVRVVAFGDGHSDVFAVGSDRLHETVDACNKARAKYKLAPLAKDLDGPPPG